MLKVAITLGIAMLMSIDAKAQQPEMRTARFVDAQGRANGQAELTAVAGGGVLIRLNVSALPPREWVAFHIHETGRCDHATGHQSAGGHFNPGSKEHGFHAASGPHAGDMPNQYVGADGAVHAEVYNASVSLDAGKTGIIGRALMIHAKPDNYRSQPAGDAGDRLACGVIE